MPSRSSPRQNLSSTSDDDRITNTLLTLNTLYQTHIHPLLPEPLRPISSNITSLILSSAPYLSQMISFLRSVLSSAWSASQGQSQDGSGSGSALLSLGVLLITLYMGLRVMNYIRRTIMGWVWLGVKMVLLMAVVQVGFYVNSYGWERAMNQAGWVGGIVWGLLEDALNKDHGGQQRQPRGTRRRGQNGYNNNDYGYPQAGGRGRYG
ncbi:hypothetical protein PMZ80_001715 [Knufia obscura]|uniref:Nuclear pore assembly and biogenesis-domain-containing protein n=1 Tax=Knufia obscura TaxID=1635080 RepID=A0ABR0S3X9_9EURO|nr:hypothetical protein PMZ80_001715 [Knufia obscura]